MTTTSPGTPSALTQLAAGGSPITTIELDVSGMTCAACAARIEKKLNGHFSLNSVIFTFRKSSYSRSQRFASLR